MIVGWAFPFLIEGASGFGTPAVIAAKKGYGLNKEKSVLKGASEQENIPAEPQLASSKIPTKDLLKAMLPLWGTIMVLIVTRISQLGIKAFLTASEPSLNVPLRSLGEFSISPSLVVGMKDIFNTDLSWSHAILYVPSILPFIFISLLTFWWYKSPGAMVKNAFSSTTKQMKNPTLALLGALVFVNLMMMGGADSAVNNIGDSLAGVLAVLLF